MDHILICSVDFHAKDTRIIQGGKGFSIKRWNNWIIKSWKKLFLSLCRYLKGIKTSSCRLWSLSFLCEIGTLVIKSTINEKYIKRLNGCSFIYFSLKQDIKGINMTCFNQSFLSILILSDKKASRVVAFEGYYETQVLNHLVLQSFSAK